MDEAQQNKEQSDISGGTVSEEVPKTEENLVQNTEVSEKPKS
jgi:hypothetical protein